MLGSELDRPSGHRFPPRRAALAALLLGWGCGPTSTVLPDRAPADVPAVEPSPNPSRATPRCGLDDVPPHASVASRALQRDPGPHGPWFVGQSVFEYVRPSPRDAGGYLNTGTQGGRSQVLMGPPLEVVMPANETLPSESLLRFGPPAAIAFRVETAGEHRIAVVTCPATESAPTVEIETLRDSVDAISTLSVDQLMFVGAPTRPRVEPVWVPSASELSSGFSESSDVHLNAGDVVRLSAIGRPRPGTTLRVAFDLAIWSLAEPPQ